MLIRVATICALLLALEQRLACGQSNFKRFPATVTNDGKYVLGWGIHDDEESDLAAKTEIPPHGEELGNVDSESVENYLVDTATGRIVALIPDFSFFEGSEGRENHFGLSVGWSPDDHGGIAIYEERYASGPIAWINPAEHKITDISGQIEKAIRRIAIQKHGKKAADYEISVSSPVFLNPRRVVLNVMVGELSSKRENAAYYSCDVIFNIKGNLNAPELELATVKWVSQDSESDSSQQEDEETQLNRVYRKLAGSFSARDRESLKQEQLKWLDTREHITDTEKDEQEFQQLEFTRRRITELQTRASFR
jgi:uncharacterized protein YecT (DUF1311 family)